MSSASAMMLRTASEVFCFVSRLNFKLCT
ncbi:hypothetical protein OIU76_005491 [Salix suchowensis]|nr:hypothetical protein OIU76_005491 [Salix suchowensis]